MIGTYVFHPFFLPSLLISPSFPTSSRSSRLPSLPLDLFFLSSLLVSPSFPPYLLSIISPSFPPYLQHVPSQLDHSESDFIHVYIKQNFCEITKVVKNTKKQNQQKSLFYVYNTSVNCMTISVQVVVPVVFCC